MLILQAVTICRILNLVSEQFVKDNVFHDGYYQSYSLKYYWRSKDFTYNVGGKIYMNNGIIVDDVSRAKAII